MTVSAGTRLSAIATAFAIGIAGAANAAPVTYQFTPTIPPPIPLSITLTITDTAVARGTFALSLTHSTSLSGDVGDFQSLFVHVGKAGTTDSLDMAQPSLPFSNPGNFYAFTLDFGFNPANGEVTRAAISTQGYQEDVDLAGTALASGHYTTDFRPCNNSLDPCAVSGAWSDPPGVTSSIPESSTMVLFLSFIGIGLVAWLMSASPRGRGMFQ